MRKYRTKIYLRFLVVVFLFVVFVNLVINIVIARSYPAMIAKANAEFSYELSVKRLFFIFPDIIVLKRVTLKPKLDARVDEALAIPLVVARFSWAGLIFKNTVLINAISLYRSRVDYNAFCAFLKDNSARITEILDNLPKADIVFKLKRGAWIFAGDAAAPKTLSTDFTLALRGNLLTVTGTAGPGNTKKPADTIPLRYRFRGVLTPKGVSITKVSLRSRDFHSQFWGDVASGVLQLKGFMMVDRPPAEFTAGGFLSEMIRKQTRILFEDVVDPSTGVPDAKTELYLLDIDSRVRIGLAGLNVERLYFTLNNTPVSVNGKVTLDTVPGVDLSGSFYFSKDTRKTNEAFKQVDLDFDGVLEGGRLRGDGVARFIFVKRKTAGYSPQDLEIRFHDFSSGISAEHQMSVTVSEGGVFYRVNGNEHKVTLNDFSALINLQPGRFKFFEVQGPFYEGHLTGRMWLDTDAEPQQMTALVDLKGAQANRMEEFLIHFAKIDGTLSSQMDFRNDPEVLLSGNISIADGELENFAFFQWLAETFRLPSLHRVDFKTVSTDFQLDMKSAALDNILLNSRQITLGGYFHVDKSNLVSSKVALSFSRPLLNESPKLRSIARLVGPNVDLLTFDFQLSGDQNAMNFQWLQSDFKQRIEQRIPNFIERFIEKQVDAIINAPVEK